MEQVVGRTVELAETDRFLEALRDGYRVLAFEGGAGYGKTALLDSAIVAARSRGLQISRARPTETEAEVGFVVLADLLGRPNDDVLEALPEPRRRALAIALRHIEPDGRPVDPLAVGLAVLAVLQNRAASAPLLLAVDDLQWCDVPSARALEFALRRLDAEPVGLAVAVRTGAGASSALPAARDRIVRVPVGALPEPEFVSLVHARSRGTLPRPTLRHLHAVCNGNPLFGCEIAALLADQPVRPGEALPVPATVSEAISSRLARLPASSREPLVAAAALTRPTMAALEAAFPDQQLEEVLAPAVEASLLTTDGDRLRFSHPLVAAAVYRSATARRQRHVHALLAASLEDEEERAVHLALSSPQADEAVADALERAAASARSRGAPDAAARLLERAAAATPEHDQPAIHRRTLEAARNHFAAGDTGHARELLEALVQIPAPAARQAEALLELARATENDVAVASRHAYEALALAQGDARVEVQVRHYLADFHFGAGDAVRGAEHAYTARRVAEADGDERLVAAAVARAANVDAWLGKPVALDELERAVEIERRLGLEESLDRPSVMLADYLKRIGRYETSRKLHLEDLAAARNDGDERETASTLTGLADIEARAGNLRAAIGYATELIEYGDQLGDLALFSNGLLHRAGALALLGRLDEAAADVAAGHPAAKTAGIDIFCAAFDHAQGVIELGRGRHEEALEHFDRAEQTYDDAGIGHPGYRKLPTGIEALLALGRLDEAEGQIARAEARCLPDRDARVLAVTDRYRALLASLRGDHEAAEEAFAEACAFHERAPSPYELARTLLALGIARRRSKRRSDARDALQRAAALFEKVGADAWAERTRAEEKALGLRRSSGDELTPMEREVAAVVARGATTREAAASLYITPKTVEFHLRNIYRKLGVRSRAELANTMRVQEEQV